LAIDKPIHFSKPWRHVSIRSLPRAGTIFGAVVAWKVLLLLLFALPLPSNDSFFYDGPVVNLLLHGRYMNPSLAAALPINGTQFFSAYPPLYQLVLAVWMTVFGTSALSAMSFHLVLFSLYVGVLWATLSRLALSSRAVGLAGLFLLAVTFHDRPDSLAHLLGMLEVYAYVRASVPSMPPGIASSSSGWWWLMAICSVLSVATGLQIGALYLLVLWAAVLLRKVLARGPIPMVPLATTVIVPGILIGTVVFVFPDLWAGFLEHAHQTPSFTGFRFPGLEELLKVIRTVPGVLAVAGLVPFVLIRRKPPNPDVLTADKSAPTNDCGTPFTPNTILLLACTSSVLLIVVASLFVLTPNAVTFGLYLQPLVVALFLSQILMQQRGERWVRLSQGLFLALALLASIRAIGLSTWGVACAFDSGYPKAIRRIQEELTQCKPGTVVVLSSAYLYSSAEVDTVRQYHSDWLAPAERSSRNTDWDGLLKLKPELILVTPFDYYRRYDRLLEQLRARRDLASFEIGFNYKLSPPDANKQIQRVVQHVSWTPVVIRIRWN
jgi:hypothetical protein